MTLIKISVNYKLRRNPKISFDILWYYKQTVAVFQAYLLICFQAQLLMFFQLVRKSNTAVCVSNINLHTTNKIDNYERNGNKWASNEKVSDHCGIEVFVIVHDWVNCTAT